MRFPDGRIDKTVPDLFYGYTFDDNFVGCKIFRHAWQITFWPIELISLSMAFIFLLNIKDWFYYCDGRTDWFIKTEKPLMH